jgi:hypothetical protein
MNVALEDDSTQGAVPASPEHALEVLADTPERVLSGTKYKRFSITLVHQTNTCAASEPCFLGTHLLSRGNAFHEVRAFVPSNERCAARTAKTDIERGRGRRSPWPYLLSHQTLD